MMMVMWMLNHMRTGLKDSRKETKMSICPCGYWWADCDENGEPISFEYCHYEGPAEWAPCEQENYDEYANEARIEEEAAREEAEWLAEME